MTIEIGDRRIGEGERPFIIAEVGINARDDTVLAKSFIEAAADAGADAVKFQTHLPDAEMVEAELRRIGHGDVYDVVAGCAFGVEAHEELKAYCQEQGVTFLSTPFSVDAVDILDDLNVPAIKIGSGEMTNFHLLRRAARTGRPLLVSTGMSDFEEVRTTYEFLEGEDADFAFLYCVSSYPTDPRKFNFGTIEAMHAEFEVPVGFSDHSTGIEATALAMARGASIVEKHFTIDRRLPGPDQSVSVEPEEFAEIAAYADLVLASSGSEKPVLEEESAIRDWAHHSVTTRTRIEEGEEFTEENLTTKRPGTGIPASAFFDVLGMRAATGLNANVVLTDSDVVGSE